MRLPTTRGGFAACIRAHYDPDRLRRIHAVLLTTGLARKNSLLTQILLSLVSAGHMPYARALFDDMHKPRVFLWNTLIRAYATHRLPADAFTLFHRMRRLAVRPDNFTFPFVLRACAELHEVGLGATVHSLLVKFGLVVDAVVATEMMIMYAKFGDADSANDVFVELGAQKDLVAWNALISALAQNGRADKALELFREMDAVGVKPDAVTIVSAISSCAYLGFLDAGKKLHMRIEREKVKTNVFVDNALLDMYAKCGSMEEASKLFHQMRQRNVVSWSTMIAGHAINGDSWQALKLFARMQEEGVAPNHVTHLAVLSACCHSGLVSEGKKHFKSIANARIEHYASMVDLLARSGNLDEAYDFIKDMPLEPDAAVWGSLLSACRVYSNLDLGQIAADEVLRLAPDSSSSSSYHVLLSNIFAASGRWDDVEKIRERMRGNSLKKTASYSSVELRGEVYIFHEGYYTRSKELYAKLDELNCMLMRIGYVPMTGVVLHDVEAEEKEAAVRTHSEKLAVAFGLMKSDSRLSPLRIMKNLRKNVSRAPRIFRAHTFYVYGHMKEQKLETSWNPNCMQMIIWMNDLYERVLNRNYSPLTVLELKAYPHLSCWAKSRSISRNCNGCCIGGHNPHGK